MPRACACVFTCTCKAACRGQGWLLHLLHSVLAASPDTNLERNAKEVVLFFLFVLSFLYRQLPLPLSLTWRDGTGRGTGAPAHPCAPGSCVFGNRKAQAQNPAPGPGPGPARSADADREQQASEARRGENLTTTRR